jgi:hypothetical protein
MLLFYRTDLNRRFQYIHYSYVSVYPRQNAGTAVIVWRWRPELFRPRGQDTMVSSTGLDHNLTWTSTSRVPGEMVLTLAQSKWTLHIVQVFVVTSTYMHGLQQVMASVLQV